MRRVWLGVMLLLLSFSAFAQHYAARVVASGLYIPWEICYGPDHHIWLTQKNGFVCRLEPAGGKMDTILHLPDVVIKGGGEGGLLGMALHPSFRDTPYVYLAYNYYKAGGYIEKIVRYTYNGKKLVSPLVLLDDIRSELLHNGCRLVIGGHKLYISTGDATDKSTAQNLSSLNGKTLCMNLDGTVPADNPIPGSYVWNWGQRNVQGMVFAHDQLYSSMHGADTDDEINILLKGRNYGWPAVEGFCDAPSETAFCKDSNVVAPIYTWTPTTAPSGMDYYDHDMFPDLKGALILTTLKAQRVLALKLNSSFDKVISVTAIDSFGRHRFRDICISPEGRIYASTSQWGGDQIIELYDPKSTAVAAVRGQVPLQLWPNPAAESVQIQIGRELVGDGHYELRTTEGRTLLRGKLQQAGTSLDISLLPAGIYLLYGYHPSAATTVLKLLKN